MAVVSVTIPCHNGEAFVESAIRSVLAQTFEDFELVIVDDGSSDRTGEIVTEIGDQRIRYVYQEHSGLATTRNRLVQLATSGYIALLDQDDWWESTRLQRQLDLFRRNSALALVFSDCRIVDVDDGSLGLWSRRACLRSGWVLSDLLKENFIPLSTVLIKKQAILDVGGFNQYTICEDYDLFLRCASRHPFDFVNEPLASYRVHPGQASRHYEMELKELLKIYSEWRFSKPAAPLLRANARGVAEAYYNAGKRALLCDDSLLKARCYLRQSLDGKRMFKVAALYGSTLVAPGITRRIVKRLTTGPERFSSAL